MTFEELLDQALAMLQRRGRVSYSALQRQFELDDAYVEDLKDELLFSHPEISEADGRGLVWNGEAEKSPTSQPSPSQPQSQPPSTYTPPHLAERIRAEQAAMESRG